MWNMDLNMIENKQKQKTKHVRAAVQMNCI